ncbi:MAG: hypothetical protein KBA31_15820 [Alphaproteobacteria bacterium]|nr:hypothetical protein [Alphaproteobacteria bacterium]
MANATVTLPKELAALVKERQRRGGHSTLDAAAASLIADGLLLRRLDEDHSAGMSDEQLRALIDEADDGETKPWDPIAMRRQLRQAATKSRKKK